MSSTMDWILKPLKSKRELKVTVAVIWAWEPDLYTEYKGTELEWRLAGRETLFYIKQAQQVIQWTYTTWNQAVETGYSNWLEDKKLKTDEKARNFVKVGKRDWRKRRKPEEPLRYMWGTRMNKRPKRGDWTDNPSITGQRPCLRVQELVRKTLALLTVPSEMNASQQLHRTLKPTKHSTRVKGACVYSSLCPLIGKHS